MVNLPIRLTVGLEEPRRVVLSEGMSLTLSGEDGQVYVLYRLNAEALELEVYHRTTVATPPEIHVFESQRESRNEGGDGAG